jgi:hypothetical protein
MPITFFGKQSVIHKEFMPEGRTDSSAFYIDIIRSLMKQISRVRPQFQAFLVA